MDWRFLQEEIVSAQEAVTDMKDFGTAIILAGGKSSRMGFDKQTLRFRERGLMDGLIKKLRKDFDEIIVVTNKPELYIGLADVITQDIIPDMGPLSGIHAGLLRASSKYSFVTACDMPNINHDYIRYMMDMVKGEVHLACVTLLGQWIEPFNAFYNVDMVGDIEKFLKRGEKAVHRLLKDMDVCLIPEEKARTFSPEWEMFFNINTREDLGEYLRDGGLDEPAE
ncbi:MAG: molybdenum cofactor guanylyltransferase [Gudongella sp.]|nr:molybdenum cofactor guanylyltransferase [Gudongella sp.]